MSEKIKSYAAKEAGGKFEPFEFEAGELGSEEIEIKVDYCGICHSDLSMLNNEWMMTEYPFVGGHEVVGKITAKGDSVKGLKVGDTVGLGWNSATCGHCDNCISGFQINCPNLEGTIVERHGGFAEKVRCNWDWAVKLPDEMDASKAGPLFCGGITVFNPFVQNDIKPTDKVGVIGIGGLGHLALQFADKWGCEVTAFTSDLSKTDELKEMGADFVVNSRDDAEIEKLAGKFDMILSTVNVPLNWKAYIGGTRAERQTASGRRGFRTRSGRRVRSDYGTKKRHRNGDRKPDCRPKNGRVLRPSRHRNRHGKLQNVGDQRSLRASRKRQGALSNCFGE